MQPSGVYAVARSVWDDPDFEREAFTQREAWLWMIGAAAWQQTRVRGSHGPVVLERGELCFAERFLAEKWQWSKTSVGRFLDLLEKRGMVRGAHRGSEKIYSINKYNDFQVVGLPGRTSKRTDNRTSSGADADQKRTKEETFKHSNIETETLPGKPGDVRRPSPHGYDAEFEAFWRAFKPPPNASKPDAWKAWEQIADKRPPLAELLAAVEAYNAWIAEQGRKQKRDYPKQHAATWLRGEIWANYQAQQSGPIDADAMNAVWGGKAAPLVAEIGAAKFKAWFGAALFEQVNPRKVCITVEKPFQRSWISNNYAPILERIYGQCELKVAA